MSLKSPWRGAGAGPRGARMLALRRFGRLTFSYFFSREWKVAWPMLLLLAAHRIGASYLMLLTAFWSKSLLDALAAMRAAAMPTLIVQYFAIATVQVFAELVAGYVQPMLAMRWRAWITADYQERWLRGNAFLHIERSEQVDNPDQRIAEDAWEFSSQLLALGLNFLGAVSGVYLMGGLLLRASAPIRLGVFGHVVRLPGDLLIYAVIYSLLCSWLVIYVGRPFIRRTQHQQQLEANYRFRLVNVRRNAEQIAFARAGASEWRMLTTDFMAVFRNFRWVQITSLYLYGFNNFFSNLQSIIPLMIIVPRYFAKKITLGTIMQSQQAFGSFSMSLSWFIQNYPAIGVILAASNRLSELDAAILSPPPCGLTTTRVDSGLETRALRLDRPNGAPLAGIGDWRIRKGERWCVSGPSGAGKSTLLRALADIWPYGRGEVRLPAEGGVMFLPQRAYLPMGPLKEALTFPGACDHLGDADCIEALELFRLGEWRPALHESARWQDRLSPGEQQRMALARVVLQRPDYLFLDEATSALDPENAAHAFTTLLDALPGLTLVSVLHDPALERFHTAKLVIEQGLAHQTSLPIRP